MSATFSKSDRQFLKSVGIQAEPTLDETRMDLARRIAKHKAPVRVPVATDTARLALVRFAAKKLLTASEDHE
jgi:hypothetical protein